MSSTDQISPPSPAAGAGVGVLGEVREARHEAEAAEVRVLVGAVEWAVQNPPLFGRQAAVSYAPTVGGEAPQKRDLTADGVPDVDRAAVAELGIALGVSTQAAQVLIADGLELAYRLPAVWSRVVAGEVKPWRARRIAQASRPLSTLAAALVDRQVAPFADRVSGPQLEGLVESAIALHDQELGDRIAAERAELRGFEIALAETSLAGLTPVSGVLDLPDAQDLDAALSQAAAELAAWGSEDTLDVRRARGAGELARNYLTFTGHGTEVDSDPTAPESTTAPAAAARADRGGPSKRQVVLYVHLTDTTIRTMIERDRRTAAGEQQGGRTVLIGRAENTDTPISAEVIREWVADPNNKVSIRPIVDLLERQRSGSYEIPTRLKEQIRLRDGTCIFPGCYAKALRCQADHTDPYDHDNPEAGGQSESCNLGLLCQLHHNLKTHHGFRYVMLDNGAVLWRTPHGLLIRRNRDGTLDYLTRHRAGHGPPGGTGARGAGGTGESAGPSRNRVPDWTPTGMAALDEPTRAALAALAGDDPGVDPPPF